MMRCRMELRERYPRALITGVSSGLGRAFTEMLLREGVTVWGTSRDPARLNFGPGFHPVACELTSPDAVVQLVKTVEAEAGGIDLLINNAGFGIFSAFDEGGREAFETQVEVLLLRAAELCRRMLPNMRKKQAGAVVNISSLAAEFPLPCMSGYNVAKAGLSALSRSLMLEYSSEGIAVIDFRPGDFRTGFNRSMSSLSPAPSGASAGVWRVLEKNLVGAPAPSRAAKDLRRALLTGKSGVVRSGSFFQARLAPLGNHCLPEAWMRRFIRRYYFCGEPSSNGVRPPPDRVRILVLSSGTGGGHDARANAFREWVDRLYGAAVDVRVERVLEDASLVGRCGVHLYNEIQKRAPWLHHPFFWFVEGLTLIHRRSVALGGHYYRELLESYRPHLLFSVHDCLNRGYFPVARKLLGEDRVRCATYCGEFSGGYGYSINWVEPSVDLYISRTKPARDYAIKRGMPSHKTAIRGHFMPPSTFFDVLSEQEKEVFLTEELGLRKDLTTVFLATGGMGANNHLAILSVLAEWPDRYQAIVVCGSNEKAPAAVREWKGRHPAFGCFVEGNSTQVHRLMQVSQFIVTRGGTTTCAKALHFRCPIVFNTFGGVMPQEKLTIRYFLDAEAAAIARNPGDLRRLLGLWHEQPERFLKMCSCFQQLRFEEDPEQVIRELVDLAREVVDR
ncbi:MAG: SDR family NAD(P)-dependent oxidoreductase [Opitutales bacterium]